MASNSFWGRARVFSKSRYAERVLMPFVDEGSFSAGICGGGGGGGKGDDNVEDCGAGLGMGIGIEAFFLKF
jgi:hypothetical protein